MSVLTEVKAELNRARAKHGDQQHLPLGTGGPDWKRMADEAKANCARQLANGSVTWMDIALEEVCETFAERDPAKVRAEAIQAAAMFVRIAEKVDHDTRATNPVAVGQRIVAEDYGWGTIDRVQPDSHLGPVAGVKWDTSPRSMPYDLDWVSRQRRVSPKRFPTVEDAFGPGDQACDQCGRLEVCADGCPNS